VYGTRSVCFTGRFFTACCVFRVHTLFRFNKKKPVIISPAILLILISIAFLSGVRNLNDIHGCAVSYFLVHIKAAGWNC
jgi:hypothetical protein